MSFFTNLANKAGNAIEINMLKRDREKCIEKCEQLKKKLSRYDHLSNFKVEFKAELDSLQALQNKLRTQFLNENIDVDQYMSGAIMLPGDVQKTATHTSDKKDAANELTQSLQQQTMSDIDSIHSQFLRSYKSLGITIKSLSLSITEINKEIGIDKSSYELKLKEAQEELEEIDRKLGIVREKQFGKK